MEAGRYRLLQVELPGKKRGEQEQPLGVGDCRKE